MIEIHQVVNRKRRRQFLQLPYKIYQDCPFWVPPLGASEKAMAGFGHHPFFADVESQAFVALKNGQVAGRILATDNLPCRRWRKEAIGFVGFFESVNDQDVASALFDAARNWLGDRKLEQMRGPFNPSVNYVSGCLIDHFEEVPTIFTSYNLPYYPALYEQYGFCKAMDLLSFRGHVDMLQGIDPKIARIADQAQERFGIKIRHFHFERLEQDFRSFFDIFAQSISHQFAMYPLPDPEIKYLASSLRPFLLPQFTALAEVNGQLIGGVLALPDLNPVIKQMDGRKFPWGWRHWRSRFCDVQRVRAMITVVRPEYNLWGVGPLLYRFLYLQNESNGNPCARLKEFEFSWIFENNLLSRGTVQRGGAQHCKTHRIYEISI